MRNTPKKWTAMLLGAFAPPLGMLYVGNVAWAIGYVIAGLGIGLSDIVYLHQAPPALAGLQIAYPIVCVFHASRLAGQFPVDRRRPRYSRWYGLAGVTLCFLAITFLTRAFVVEPFRVPSGSMLPTIEPGSYMIVEKWGYGNYSAYGITALRKPISSLLKRGDVIVFNSPANKSLRYVARLVGLPGDKVMYQDKKLWINGKEVPTKKLGDYLNMHTMSHSPQFAERLTDREYSVIIENEAPPGILASPSYSFAYRSNCVYDARGVTCEVPDGHYYVMGDNRDNSNDSRTWGFVPADHLVGKVAHVFP